jgi:hypothetical protein
MGKVKESGARSKYLGVRIKGQEIGFRIRVEESTNL